MPTRSATVRFWHCLALAAAAFLCGIAATKGAKAQPVSVVQTVRGKSCVVVNGKPYLLYGVQMRLDHLLDGDFSTGKMAQAAEYFQHAKALGFRSVVVPVHWADIEPAEGKYDFASYLDKVIDDADANQLDVQLLWYGSDVCGWNLVPRYVADDRSRFPRRSPYEDFFDLAGNTLIGREKAAVAAMMAHLAAYDIHRRVVMIQVENEPDGAGSITSSVKWGDAADMRAKMFAGGQFDAANALCDTLGNVIHDSPDSMVTRVNIGTTYRALDCYRARPAHDAGIDIVGVDTYSVDPKAEREAIETIPLNAPGNVSHQPEGGGKSGNLINLILADFEEGGGSLIYELRSYGANGDNGIFRHVDDPDTWQERDGTETVRNGQPENKTSQIRAFNQLVDKADQKIAVAAKGDCAAFNVDAHPGHWSEQRTVAGKPLTYETWDGSPAFALQDADGDLILMNLTDGNVFTLDPSSRHDATASVGCYDANDVWHEQYRKTFTGNSLLMWKGDVVKIPALSQDAARK